MKLIRELNEKVDVVKNNDGDMYIEGIFLQADIRNQNGRVYPFALLERETARYIAESVSRNTALGELGHPDNPTINLERVSHRIVHLQREGSNWIGRALITKTPFGDIARGLLDSGARLGVSSRGLGTVDNSGIVQEDYHIITAADIVADPSAPDAWVKGLMEQVDWVYRPGSGWVPEIAEKSRKEVERAVASRTLAETRAELMARYMIRLSEALRHEFYKQQSPRPRIKKFPK